MLAPKEAPSIELGPPGRGEAGGSRLSQQASSWVLSQGLDRTEREEWAGRELVQSRWRVQPGPDKTKM